MEPVVLEDWLRLPSSSNSSPSSAASPATESATELAANAIVNAWAEVRVSVQRKALNSSDAAAIDLLDRHRRSLHLADSQAKLLLALLTQVSASDSALLGRARRFAILGLLAWIRKCFTANGTNTSSLIKAPEAIASLVDNVRKAVEDRSLSDQFICEAILLLGTISTLQSVPPDVRNVCLTTIVVELRERKEVITRGAIVEALAGAGLALSVAQEHLVPILRALLLLWTPHFAANVRELSPAPGAEAQILGGSLQTGESMGNGAIVNDVIKLLHLMDYLGSVFLSKQNSRIENTTPIERIHDALLRELQSNNADCAVQCTTIMSSVGLLRSLYRWVEANKKRGDSSPIDFKWLEISASLENVVVQICERAITLDVSMFTFRDHGSFHGGPTPTGASLQLCRCVGVAVSRCRGLPAHPSILRCLLTCIFGDTLHLHTLYSAMGTQLLEIRNESLALEEEKLLPGEPEVDKLKVHMESVSFQELGSITRAMCDQYSRISRDLQGQTEFLVTDYCRNLYQKHRLLLATPRRTLTQYRQTLEKVLQAAFITVVIFLSFAVKERVSDEHQKITEAVPTALALDSLSCVEYFRHVQLREFSTVIQRCVSQISTSEDDALAFAHLIPRYDDVFRHPGVADGNLSYSWTQDEVQTARILFYFRVLPLCLSKFPEATFATEVAPLMFLYLQHPSEAVSKATHALFAAFISLGARPKLTLKVKSIKSKKANSSGAATKQNLTVGEQFVACYMQRSLEEFPGVTPFHGLVAGVGAIIKHLPPGSVATVYCLNCLVDKAINLYNTNSDSMNVEEAPSDPQKDLSQGTNNEQKQLPKEIAAAQKLQILLLHLILLVDMQVFPLLLKLVAKLILSIPLDFQTAALVEAFDVVGGTDDYTQKPVIVPWLQSLSHLVYENQTKSKPVEPLKKGNDIPKETRSTIETTQNTETGDGGKDEKPGHATQETADEDKRVPSTETAVNREEGISLDHEPHKGDEKVEERSDEDGLILRSKL